MKKIFEGVGVAIVTPFLDGVVDYDSFENLINDVIDKGASAVIVLGTTGESVAISQDERREIIEFAKNQIQNRAKLVVGTGNNNFDLAKTNTQMAKDLGADACLVVTPYYNKTTQQGLIEYYSKLSEIELPIIMYNIPARTGLNIELDTVKKLLENPYIYGIKESTTDITRIMVLMSICKDKVSVYSGEDALNYIFYTLGADGCISVTANAYTKQVKTVFDLVKSNNYKCALKQQALMADLNDKMFCETNPIPIKYLLNKQNKIKSFETRLPLVTPSEEHKQQIEESADIYDERTKRLY